MPLSPSRTWQDVKPLTMPLNTRCFVVVELSPTCLALKILKIMIQTFSVFSPFDMQMLVKFYQSHPENPENPENPDSDKL